MDDTPSELEKVGHWFYTDQLPNGEKVNIQDETAYPFDSAQLPSEASQYLDPVNPDDKQYFLSATSQEVAPKPLGFIILEFTARGDPRQIDLRYRYVFPEARRRGIGAILKMEAYEWARAQGFAQVNSGINDVFRLGDDGSVLPIIDEKIDGNYISYNATARGTFRDGSYPIHQIESVTIGDGRVSLSFRTKLLDESGQRLQSNEPSLPYDPNGLFAVIQRDVLPNNMSTQDLLGLSRAQGAVKFSDKKQIPLISEPPPGNYHQSI